jgi:hypothetical protein
MSQRRSNFIGDSLHRKNKSLTKEGKYSSEEIIRGKIRKQGRLSSFDSIYEKISHTDNIFVDAE